MADAKIWENQGLPIPKPGHKEAPAAPVAIQAPLVLHTLIVVLDGEMRQEIEIEQMLQQITGCPWNCVSVEAAWRCVDTGALVAYSIQTARPAVFVSALANQDDLLVMQFRVDGFGVQKMEECPQGWSDVDMLRRLLEASTAVLEYVDLDTSRESIRLRKQRRKAIQNLELVTKELSGSLKGDWECR